MTMRFWATGVMLLVLTISVTDVAASNYMGNPDNYRRLLRQLGPGDTLRLAPGKYRRGLVIHNLHGEPSRPIVIEGPEARERAVMLGRSRHNIISIKDSSHVTIRNLEIDGRGAFVDGVKCEGHAEYAHHITLENLHIHSLAKQQQSVGISTKCPAWDWIIRGNRIEGVGTGMYFGNSNGKDPFIGGIIEDNDVANTIGYNLQIKHQKTRPAIDGMPTETRFTIIRRNRFVKEKGGSIGEAARPNVLVGHLPLVGPGTDDTYAIYGNLFLENPNEALFQGEGNIALYSNVFFNSHALAFPAIAIQPHNDIPRKVRVFFNTVIHPARGVRVLRREERWVDDQLLFGNAVFARRAFEGGRLGDNFTADFSDASEYLRAPSIRSVASSFAPHKHKLRAERSIIGFIGFPESDRDLNGQRRDGAYYGAMRPPSDAVRH